MNINIKKINNQDIKNNNTNKFNYKLFISIIAFIFLTISLVRFPYIGEFTDAITFSFLFGWSKYIIYIYLLTLIILYWSKKIKKPLYSKRAFLILFISSFLLSCLLSSIQKFMIQDNTNNYGQFFLIYLNQWKDFIFTSDNQISYVSFIDNKIYIDGGFFGSSINTISNIIIMIISIIGIFILYLLIFAKQRNIIFSFLRKKIKNNKSIMNFENEIKIDTKINDHDNKTIIDNAYLDSILNDQKNKYLSLKENSDILNFDSHLISDNVLKFFKNNQIDFAKFNKEDNDKLLSLIFLIDSDNYQKFRELLPTFKFSISNMTYNTRYENNELHIEFNKLKEINNILLQRVLISKVVNPFDISFFTSSNIPTYLNLRKNSLIGVFDCKDKNIINLINNIIASISWNYKTSQVKIYYLSIKNINLNIFKSPNFCDTEIFTTKDIISFLTKINKDMITMLNLFKKNNVNDIYSYNSISKTQKENIVILINDFNQILDINPNILSLINDINKFSHLCGITIITFDKSINALSYNNLSYKISLLFKSSLEVSKKIMNNIDATNLNIMNNAFLHNSANNKSLEVFIPNIQENEIEIIVNQLKECYKNKKI